MGKQSMEIKTESERLRGCGTPKARAELKRVGWTEKELGRRPKGDKEKVKIDLRLRQETTVTVGWIAGRLKMGSRGAVSNLLNRK
jgi:hypothetical protein